MKAVPWIMTDVATERQRTAHLSSEEFGAYELLRRHVHQHGSLPRNAAAMAIVTRLPPERWEGMANAVLLLLEGGRPDS